MKTKIAVIDDNNFLIKSVRDKLSFFDEITISFTANNGIECLEKLADNRLIDLILMDIEMPKLNGIETTALVKQKYPQIKIIVLTVFDDDENIFNAIQAGADGYLLKDTEPKELYNANLQTREGGAVMTPSIALKTLNLLRLPLETKTEEEDETIKLTNREIEVLEQLATGLPYTSIAENLIVAPSTIRRHIENIYHKLQVHSKTEAIALARKKRLI
ncbi:response regulator [Flavobacterium haoranii]|uniref:Two component transcriptional regulator, LuxR family n=1 Tax=Flavobacterium haoranii TaxID=683124 RepID=A0A1M6HG99_9FLAO|nr:response regulator transcription factor [Flavobacterium haoranii]SHJ21211.1 two component transcriptional regulator, LuxR family [Flavobacterium haoranii]